MGVKGVARERGELSEGCRQETILTNNLALRRAEDTLYKPEERELEKRTIFSFSRVECISTEESGLNITPSCSQTLSNV